MTAVVQDAVHHFEAHKTLRNIEWFAPPKPIYREIKRIAAPTLLSALQKKWAAARSLEFHRLCASNKCISTGSVLVSISDSLARRLALWLCPLTHAYSAMLLKMEPSLQEDSDTIDVKIVVPTIAKSTPDMFAEYYEQCVVRHAKLLVTLQFISWGRDGATLALGDTDEGDVPLVELEMVLDDTFPREKGPCFHIATCKSCKWVSGFVY